MNSFIFHPLTNDSICSRITCEKRACITWARLNIRPSLLQHRLKAHWRPAVTPCHGRMSSAVTQRNSSCLHAWLPQIIKWSVPLGRVTVWATTDLERSSELRQSFPCSSGPWKEKERKFESANAATRHVWATPPAHTHLALSPSACQLGSTLKLLGAKSLDFSVQMRVELYLKYSIVWKLFNPAIQICRWPYNPFALQDA